MSDVKSDLELKNTDGAAGILQWADVFYGVLAAPLATMAVLADDTQYQSNTTAMCLAGFTVTSAALFALIGAAGGDFGAACQIAIVFCFLLCLLYWAFLSLLLYSLARIIKSPNGNLGSSFVVTGWTFLPLFFVSPAKCLLNIPVFGVIVFLALVLWMLFLEYAAFKAILGLEHKRMLALSLIVPLLYKLSVSAGVIFFLALIF